MTKATAEQYEFISHPNKTFVSYQSAKQLDPDQTRRFLIWVQTVCKGYLQAKDCFVFLTGSFFLTSYHCLSVCLSVCLS